MGRCGVSVSFFFLNHRSGIMGTLEIAGWHVCCGQGWGLGGMELWVGSNKMILFSLYIAVSHTAHVLFSV